MELFWIDSLKRMNDSFEPIHWNAEMNRTSSRGFLVVSWPEEGATVFQHILWLTVCVCVCVCVCVSEEFPEASARYINLNVNKKQMFFKLFLNIQTLKKNFSNCYQEYKNAKH